MAGRNLFAEDKGFLQNAWEGTQRGLEQAGIGIWQAVNDASGGEVFKYVNDQIGGDKTPEEIDAAVRGRVDDLEQQGKGTGVGGFVGEALGSPTTYLPILGKGLAGMAASGVATGTGQGAIMPLGEGDSRSDNMRASAIISGLVSPVVGKLTNPVRNQNATGEAARLAQVLKDEGIDLTAAQATGSKALQGMEATLGELPFTSSKVAARADTQASQFNRAVLAKAGINADEVTPAVLKQAKESFGDAYDAISARNTITVDDQLLNSLASVEQRAFDNLGADDVKPIRNLIDRILKDASDTGAITGETFKVTRSELGKLTRGKEDFKSLLLQDVKRSLTDAMKRSLPKEEAALWGQLDQKYAAFKTIDRAMRGTNDEILSGGIAPTKLLQSVMTKNTGYSTGAGPLNDLARAGKLYLPEKIGNPGTANRLMWQRLLTGGGLLGAAGYVASGGDMETAATVGAAGLALPKAVQTLVDSPAVQSYLKNGLPDAVGGALRSGAVDIGQELRNAQQGYEKPAGRNLFAPAVGQDSLGGSAGADTLPQHLRTDEGLRHSVYTDTTGNRTVAWGFNMDSGIARNVWKKAGIKTPFKDVYAGEARISDDDAEALGRASFEIAKGDAESLYGDISDFSPSRREALLNLSYQLGKPTMMGFRNFNAAVRDGRWTEAARHLLKSEYAKQAPERAREQARKLLRGA